MAPLPLPLPRPNLPKPKLRLHLDDLRHPATASFLSLVPDVLSTLETALQAIIQYLYTSPGVDNQNAIPFISATRTPPSFIPSIPPTRSVTVILRDFDGVAYTTGTRYDKEIHLSLSYIQTCCTHYKDPAGELAGVLTHELVHCYQHTSPYAVADNTDGGTANSEDDTNTTASGIPYPPSGLIEGIADFVRLKAGLVPPHWKPPSSAKERPASWDQGYQHTAYFLAWLEDTRVGIGAVGMVNDRLLRLGYVGEESAGDDSNNTTARGEKKDERCSQRESFWRGLFGVGVLALWEEYGEYLDRFGGEGKGEESGDCNEGTSKGDWETEVLDL